MSILRVSVAMTIAAALALPNAANAAPPAPRAPCFLDDSRVVSVKPYYGKPPLGRATIQPLRGAELQLVPTPGLSAEDLEARVKALLARQQTLLPACLVGVGHVHIGSTPLGEATSVTLIARDPGNAERVFRRAQRLIDE